jgi:ATP synthase protein I|tara:strand:- start:290 stop:988 length:699 start_codon:yes stop_codon:yes gene_type:complete
MSTLTHGAHVPYARRATSTPALGRRAATRRATVTFAQPSSDSSTSKKSPDAKAPSPAPAKKPPSFFENTKRPIWEMDIEGEFARQDKRKADEEAAQQKEAASGLGFGNRAMLDDPAVDLSARLRPKKKEVDENQLAIGDGSAATSGIYESTTKSPPPGTRASVALDAINSATTNKVKSKYDLDGWNYAPTKAEQARWQVGELSQSPRSIPPLRLRILVLPKGALPLSTNLID